MTTATELLQYGIAALKAGDIAKARELLSKVVIDEPINEVAWLWLSGAMTEDLEKRQCLERVLAINPNNTAAQRGLALLPRVVPSPHLPLATPVVTSSPAVSISAPPIAPSAVLSTQGAKLQSSTPQPKNSDSATASRKVVAQRKHNPLIWIVSGGITIFLLTLGVTLLGLAWQSGMVVMPIIASFPTTTPVPTITPIPGSLQGTVTWRTKGSGNKFVIGVTVKVWSNKREVQRTITDPSGKYEISDLMPGKYIVSVYETASDIGENVAEKCWVFRDVEIQSGQTAKLFMDFNNALDSSDSLCQENPKPSSNPQG